MPLSNSIKKITGNKDRETDEQCYKGTHPDMNHQ